MGIKGQKVHPVGWRVGVHRKWKHNWFQENKNYTRFLLINLNLEKIIQNIFYYHQKNILILKFRILGFMLNQLFLEIFFWKQKAKRKKKKFRLFLLKRSKKKTKFLWSHFTFKNFKAKKFIWYSNSKINLPVKLIDKIKLNRFQRKRISNFFFLDIIPYLKKDSFFFNFSKDLNFLMFWQNNIYKTINFIEQINNKVLIKYNLNSDFLELGKIFFFKKMLYYYNLFYKDKNFKINFVNFFKEDIYSGYPSVNINKLMIKYLKFTKSLQNLFWIHLKFLSYFDKILVDSNSFLKIKSYLVKNEESLKKNTLILGKNFFLKKKQISFLKYTKNFIIRKKKFKNSLNNFKFILNIFSGFYISPIFINTMALFRFNRRFILNKESFNENHFKGTVGIQRSRAFFLSYEQRWFRFKVNSIIRYLNRPFKYKYPGLYMTNLIYNIYFGLFLKNPYLIVKMLALIIKKLPKNERQVRFIRKLFVLITNIGGVFPEIAGLRIQFKGRFDRWNRKKSICEESGNGIPRQKFSIFLEYASTQGLIKKGTYSIRLWIYYKPEFTVEYKKLLKKYFLYSSSF
jgi:hypothetical protein